jgi:hypothetical protein
MISPISIDRALLDERLLGAALGNSASWSTWLVVLKAAFAIEVTADELELFRAIAGERKLPASRVRELWCLVGRRAGKSRMAALIACYIACFIKHKLAAGEQGAVLVLAASTDQAQRVLGYVKAFLTTSPVLRKEIEAITTTEVRLRNGIVISVRANSFRTTRGRTLVACIFDECSFWRDDTSATPDTETYSAILPSLATVNGMLISISSAYRKVGLMHAKWRDYFGVDSDDTLVVQGTSQQFNPTLDQAVIDAQRKADPVAARSEWDSEFRAELTAYLDDALIERAIDHGRPLELPPRPGVSYQAYIDASGGVGHDAYTCCIAHKEKDQYVIDLCRGTVGAFDPHEVTKAYAALLKEFRCHTVRGDFYAGEWVGSAWMGSGITYTRSPIAKSQIYQEVAPLFARGLVSLPEHPKLLRELRLLERRTHRSGKDSVDHGRNGHDDFANAMAGALRSLSAYPSGEDLVELYRRVNGDGPAPPPFGLHPQYQQFAERPPAVDAAWRQMVEDTCNAWKG